MGAGGPGTAPGTSHLPDDQVLATTHGGESAPEAPAVFCALDVGGDDLGLGILRQVFRKLPISCLPGQIPASIEHDVTELELDGAVSAGEVALPEGVRMCLPDTQTVAAVVAVKEVPTPEEEEAAAAAEAAAQEKPAEEGEAPSEEEPKPEP